MSTVNQDLDRMIDEALTTEESELLRQIGEEPNYLKQAMGVFDGQLGWVNMVLMVTQTVFFIAGVWFAWQFFQAPDTLEAIRAGFPAAVLLILGAMLKLAVWPSIQTNRILRELKRVELQMARGQLKA